MKLHLLNKTNRTKIDLQAQVKRILGWKIDWAVRAHGDYNHVMCLTCCLVPAAQLRLPAAACSGRLRDSPLIGPATYFDPFTNIGLSQSSYGTGRNFKMSLGSQLGLYRTPSINRGQYLIYTCQCPYNLRVTKKETVLHP